MASLRCSSCCISWPDELARYRKCLGCGDRTWHSNDPPHDLQASNTRAFDVFYARQQGSLAALVDETMDGLELPA